MPSAREDGAMRPDQTTHTDAGDATQRPHLAPRTTTFDRAMRKIDAEAIGAEKPWTPRSAARLYLLAERASADAQNDDAIGELSAAAAARLERIAATRSRDIGDVAAKLAALIVESGHSSPISSGGIEGAIHAGMCSCLADLVILGDRPLPDVSAVLDMRAPDFELRDATEAEMAEFQAEAQGEKATTSRRAAPMADPDIADAVAPADSVWPASLDLRQLHAALDGVVGCLAGLDELGRAGSEIKPEYLGPVLAMLVAWRDRVGVSRDLVEAQMEAMPEAAE